MECDFPEGHIVFEHVDSTELIDVNARMRSKLRLQQLRPL